MVEFKQGVLEVLLSQVLHSDIEVGHVTAGEEASSTAVCRHGLLLLVLGGKAMPKSNPAGSKVPIDIVGLGKVLASLGVLFDKKVVAADGKPGDG